MSGQRVQYRPFTHVLILETFENDNPHPLRSGRIRATRRDTGLSYKLPASDHTPITLPEA
jgi:hypothetical protein